MNKNQTHTHGVADSLDILQPLRCLLETVIHNFVIRSSVMVHSHTFVHMYIIVRFDKGRVLTWSDIPIPLTTKYLSRVWRVARGSILRGPPFQLLTDEGAVECFSREHYIAMEKTSRQVLCTQYTFFTEKPWNNFFLSLLTAFYLHFYLCIQTVCSTHAVIFTIFMGTVKKTLEMYGGAVHTLI